MVVTLFQFELSFFRELLADMGLSDPSNCKVKIRQLSQGSELLIEDDPKVSCHPGCLLLSNLLFVIFQYF